MDAATIGAGWETLCYSKSDGVCCAVTFLNFLRLASIGSIDDWVKMPIVAF
jgi:hypothetical protein